MGKQQNDAAQKTKILKAKICGVRRIVPAEVRFMSVKVTIEEVDGVSVVGLNGRIVLGEESGVLREAVKGLISAGQKKIVLNMSNVTYIDSAEIGRAHV